MPAKGWLAMMNGELITVCEYVEFNHSFLAAGGSAQEVAVLAPAIAVPGGAFIGGSVSVHARTISATAPAGYEVIVRPTHPSRRDPAEFQYLLADAVTPKIGATTNPAAVPGLIQLATPITQIQHPYVKVILRATPPASGVVQLWVILSVALIVRASG